MSIALKVIGIVMWVLKQGWIRGGQKLPLPVVFWQKLHDSLIEDKKLTKDEVVMLIIIVREQFGWNWAWDLLLKALSYLSDFVWDVSGEWSSLWEPVIESAKDGFLTWQEIGIIISAVIDWIKHRLSIHKDIIG